MFANQWVEESLYEIEDEGFDFQTRMVRINYQRREALCDIWSEHGFRGIKELIAISEAEEVIGTYVLAYLPDINEQINFIYQCVFIDENLLIKAERCLKGFIMAIEEDYRIEVLYAAAKGRMESYGFRPAINCCICCISPFAEHFEFAWNK